MVAASNGVHALHKAVSVAVGAGELSAERLAFVVVAHHQDGGRGERGEHAGETGIGRLFDPMREIAGHDDKGDVLVGCVDLFDGDRKSLGRIEPLQPAAARHEMRIGENDEFHRCIVSRSHMA